MHTMIVKAAITDIKHLVTETINMAIFFSAEIRIISIITAVQLQSIII